MPQQTTTIFIEIIFIKCRKMNSEECDIIKLNALLRKNCDIIRKDYSYARIYEKCLIEIGKFITSVMI